MTAVLPGLLLVAVILAASQTPIPPVPEQAANATDPLSLFAKMMPVFTHPRCANCHGNTDPIQNVNHGGGLVDPTRESCMEGGCHSAASDWKLATNIFVRQTARQLCEFFATSTLRAKTPAEFIAHLRDDELIKLAFVGLAGGARSTPARPPMTDAQFLTAAQVWLDDGLASCDREGVIIHTEEITSHETYDTPQELRITQDGKREVTVRFASGRYEAIVQVTGSVTIIQTIRGVVNGAPCQTVITSITDYADVDTPTPGATANAGTRGGADVEVKFQPTGDYTVTVQLPEEKHKQEEHASVQDGCGVGLQPSPREILDQVWPATRFVFRGQLPDPRDRTQLVGQSTHVWKARGASPDEDPWLPDHYAAMAQDGSIHPVTVTTKWNFRYRP